VGGITTGGAAAPLRDPVASGREIVTALWTAGLTMDTRDARVTLCAAVTTAGSSELTSTPRMTAVTDLRISQSGRNLPLSLELLWSHLQDKDAGDGTTTVRDVVLQRTLVMKERETVTDLVTEVLMMDMPVVRETWSVEATTV